MKKHLVVLVSILTLCLALPLAVSAAEVPSFSPAASCATATLAPSGALWATDDSCPSSFCQSDDYCASLCSSATSAVCVSGVCQYTFGNGGGGGNSCIQAFCYDSSQCYYAPCGQGTCVNGLCQW
jgi:hypothetical protein